MQQQVKPRALLQVGPGRQDGEERQRLADVHLHRHTPTAGPPQHAHRGRQG